MFKKLTLALLAFVLLLNALPAHAAEPITYGLGTLTGMALSPDGTRLAVGTTIGVYFYDAQTFAPQGFWPTSFSVNQIDWLAASNALVLEGSFALEVRNPEDGSVRWAVYDPPARWHDITWRLSPDGQMVAGARRRLFEVYAVATGQLLLQQTMTGEAWRYYYAPAFLGDGAQVQVCCSSTYNEQVWDTHSWQLVTSPIRPQSQYDTQYNNIGLQWQSSALIYVWALKPSKYVDTVFTGETNTAAAFSADGQWLATGAQPGLVRVWEMAHFKTPQLILRGHQAAVTNLAWSPDGHTLYSAGGNTVRAWNTTTGAQLRLLDGFSTPMRQVTWSADGQRLIAVQGEQIGAWDVASRQPVQVTAAAHIPPQWPRWATTTNNDMAVSPTGNILAVAHWGVDLYNAQTLQYLRRLPTDYNVLTAVFSPDEQWVASAGNSAFVVVWDVAKGNPIHTLLSPAQHFNMHIVALAFAPDGHSLYALEDTGILRQWDLTTDTVISAVQTSVPAVLPVRGYYDPAISPVQQKVVTERGAGGIDVSNTQTGERLYNLNAPNPTSISLNPQATRFAAIVGNTVKIWALDSGAVLAEYPTPNGTLTDIAFSPNGQSLATSNSNGTVQVWPVP